VDEGGTIRTFRTERIRLNGPTRLS